MKEAQNELCSLTPRDWLGSIYQSHERISKTRPTPKDKGTKHPRRPLTAWRAAPGLGPHPSCGGLSSNQGGWRYRGWEGAQRRARARNIAPETKFEVGLT